jgi:hypothetical protein
MQMTMKMRQVLPMLCSSSRIPLLAIAPKTHGSQ